jgi:hypothetical protein
MYIYLIRNTRNNVVYVGQTKKDIATRWKQHLDTATRESSKSYNLPMYRDMRKHGVASFKITLLETCSTVEDLNRREIELLLEFKEQGRVYNTKFTPQGIWNPNGAYGIGCGRKIIDGDVTPDHVLKLASMATLSAPNRWSKMSFDDAFGIGYISIAQYTKAYSLTWGKCKVPKFEYKDVLQYADYKEYKHFMADLPRATKKQFTDIHLKYPQWSMATLDDFIKAANDVLVDRLNERLSYLSTPEGKQEKLDWLQSDYMNPAIPGRKSHPLTYDPVEMGKYYSPWGANAGCGISKPLWSDYKTRWPEYFPVSIEELCTTKAGYRDSWVDYSYVWE